MVNVCIVEVISRFLDKKVYQVNVNNVPCGRFWKFDDAMRHIAWMGLTSPEQITVGSEKNEFYWWLNEVIALGIVPKDIVEIREKGGIVPEVSKTGVRVNGLYRE